MSVLFYGKKEVETIKNIKYHARKNKVTYADIVATKEGRRKPVGDDPNFVVVLGQYRVVYSIEEQKVGDCAHISISCAGKDPHHVAIDEIMGLFGLKYRTTTHKGYTGGQFFYEKGLIEVIEILDRKNTDEDSKPEHSSSKQKVS